MSWDYYIFSDCLVNQLASAIDNYKKLEDEYFRDIPDKQQANGIPIVYVGEHSIYQLNEAGEIIVDECDDPSTDDVITDVPLVDAVSMIYKFSGEQLPDAVQQRLLTSRSVLKLEGVDTDDQNAHQNTQLLFFLTNLGASAINWGDCDFELSEVALKKLKSRDWYTNFPMD